MHLPHNKVCVGVRVYTLFHMYDTFSSSLKKIKIKIKTFRYCRHHILYPLRLKPLFSNDVRILKPMVGLGPNQVKIDLRKVFMEIIIYFWKRKTMETLGHALMRTLIDTL